MGNQENKQPPPDLSRYGVQDMIEQRRAELQAEFDDLNDFPKDQYISIEDRRALSSHYRVRRGSASNIRGLGSGQYHFSKVNYNDMVPTCLYTLIVVLRWYSF